MNDSSIIAPRFATRAFINTANGEIIKGSGRRVSECLLGSEERSIQGFTGEEISYLRDLISLGSIKRTRANTERRWLVGLIENRLVTSTDNGGSTQYAITALGRLAVAQLL